MPIAFRRSLRPTVITKSRCSRKYHATQIVREEKNIENVADIMTDDNLEIDEQKDQQPIQRDRRWKVKAWLQEQEQRLEILRGSKYLAGTNVNTYYFRVFNNPLCTSESLNLTT